MFWMIGQLVVISTATVDKDLCFFSPSHKQIQIEHSLVTIYLHFYLLFLFNLDYENVL